MTLGPVVSNGTHARVLAPRVGFVLSWMPLKIMILSLTPLSSFSNLTAQPMSFAVCLVLILAVRSSAWEAVRIFRAADFYAFSRDLYALTAIETPGAMPSLSEINLNGSSLREVRVIAEIKTHPSSASELIIEVRLVEGIKFQTTSWTLGLWGWSLKTLNPLKYRMRIEN